MDVLYAVRLPSNGERIADMRADQLRLNGTYRLKADVLATCVQNDGSPLDAEVTIVRVKYPEGRKRAWYFDAKGNAYRAEDFAWEVEVIDVGEWIGPWD
jgi:hypothetical protein